MDSSAVTRLAQFAAIDEQQTQPRQDANEVCGVGAVTTQVTSTLERLPDARGGEAAGRHQR